MKLCSRRAESGCVELTPNPPASSAADSPRGSSSNASGLPRVSATIRSITRSSTRPAIAKPSTRARVFVIQAPQNELGQPSEGLLVSGVAHREYQRDRLCHEPPRDERERPRGRLIEPLSIVDDA